MRSLPRSFARRRLRLTISPAMVGPSAMYKTRRRPRGTYLPPSATKWLVRPGGLANVREHVCYVGLVYKVDPNRPTDRRVCCGAQMFLQTGEGVVFRGHL